MVEAESAPSVEQELDNEVQNMQITSTTSSFNGTVRQVLDQVLGKLKLQDDEIKQTNETLDSLVQRELQKYTAQPDKFYFCKSQVKKELIEGLKKQSCLFEKLYKEIKWTGSYYEGLKISKPDEFDLNIVLKMPVEDDQIKVLFS
jgi:hypothetical protein